MLRKTDHFLQCSNLQNNTHSAAHVFNLSYPNNLFYFVLGWTLYSSRWLSSPLSSWVYA